jgi:hypothetical protein
MTGSALTMASRHSLLASAHLAGQGPVRGIALPIASSRAATSFHHVTCNLTSLAASGA